MNINPVGRASLIAYSGPALPIAMMGLPLILYLPPFYASELGVELAVVGGVFFLARAWDAVIDPLVGYLSDNTNSRWGRRKPWLAVGGPLLMIGVYALLSPPSDISTTYLWLAALGFYVAWTLVQIPYQSWGSELSRDYAERSRITGFRETGTLIGVILATVLPIVAISNPEPSLREILWVFVLAQLILIPLTLCIACLVTPSPAPLTTAQPKLLPSLKVLFNNKPLLRVLSGVFCLWLGGSVLNAGLLFLWESVLELGRKDFLIYVLVQYACAIGFLPLWIRLGNRIGRHRVLVIGGAGFLMVQPLLLLATGGQFVLTVPVSIVGGCLTGVIWAMPPALVADTVEYGMLRGGGDQMALYMAAYNFIMKLALAAGVGLAFPLLGVLGFSPQGPHTGSALNALSFVVLAIPPVIGLIGAAFLFNHPLTPERHAVIRRWLARRPSNKQTEGLA